MKREPDSTKEEFKDIKSDKRQAARHKRKYGPKIHGRKLAETVRNALNKRSNQSKTK
tara:strand:- start:126 stop:296 length:171 start_codon:yes stop_codon:yes gene_type:complete